MPLPDKFNISGTPEQLAVVLPILEAMYLGFKDIKAEGGGGSYRTLPSYVKGQLLVKLYFKGIIQNTVDSHRVEKSFRLMKDNPATISLDRLKQLATKIKSKFDNLQFTTGHTTYTYNDPEIGFNRVWGHFNSSADASKLFENMLDLVDSSIDNEKYTKSAVVAATERFREPPEKVQQAGISIRTDRERPIAVMKFHKATIKFPHVRQEIDLVNEYLKTIESLEILNKYNAS